MMINTVTERKHRLLVAGALALFSQGAFSGDVSAAKSSPEELTVTAQRPQVEFDDSRIDTNVREHIDALNRRFATDLKKDLEAIGSSRIELAISKAPTRG